MKPKKCAGCGERFIPVRQFQKACSVECSVLFVVAAKQKARRKQYTAEKKRLKSRADWLREAQAAVNKYIRLRDAGKPCISCGRHHQGQWHAGHYRSVGANPEMRFIENNIHAQCAPCNNQMSGNIINYRLGLLARYGNGFVESLEGSHEAKHYSIEEIEKIKRHYSKLAREIERAE